MITSPRSLSERHLQNIFLFIILPHVISGAIEKKEREKVGQMLRICSKIQVFHYINHYQNMLQAYCSLEVIEICVWSENNRKIFYDCFQIWHKFLLLQACNICSMIYDQRRHSEFLLRWEIKEYHHAVHVPHACKWWTKFI